MDVSLWILSLCTRHLDTCVRVAAPRWTNYPWGFGEWHDLIFQKHICMQLHTHWYIYIHYKSDLYIYIHICIYIYIYIYMNVIMYVFTYFWIHIILYMCNIYIYILKKKNICACCRNSVTQSNIQGAWQSWSKKDLPFFAKTCESKRHRESSSQIDLDIKKWNHQLESLESPTIKSETINFWILLVKPLFFFGLKPPVSWCFYWVFISPKSWHWKKDSNAQRAWKICLVS